MRSLEKIIHDEPLSFKDYLLPCAVVAAVSLPVAIWAGYGHADSISKVADYARDFVYWLLSDPLYK